MTVQTLGIDLAKNVFQIHGVDKNGKEVFNKRVTRAQMPNFIAQLPICLIGMEACGGSNYWARKFKQFGHDVRLISPQYVKPYIKTNKNDLNDSKGICEAVSRPSMRFVPIKTIAQQDIQCLHRIRSNLIQERTALVNQIRGLLAEYGIVVPQGIAKIRKDLPIILADSENELTPLIREVFSDLKTYFQEKDERIQAFDKKILDVCRENEVCQRLIQVKGVGPITATALVAAVGDAKVFRNGRHMAAWLGLVPRQASSGNKQVLLGISKRGDRYLRALLIHGARSVVTALSKQEKSSNKWLESLVQRCGKFKAYVALANRNARILWALMAHGTTYKETT